MNTQEVVDIAEARDIYRRGDFKDQMAFSRAEVLADASELMTGLQGDPLKVHSFKFCLGASGGDCKLEMDGKPLRLIKSVTIHASAEGATTVSLEFLAEVEIEGDGFDTVTLSGPKSEESVNRDLAQESQAEL